MMELVKEVYKQLTMRKVGPSPPAHFHLQVMGVMTETPRAFPRNQGNRQEGLVLFWMRNQHTGFRRVISDAESPQFLQHTNKNGQYSQSSFSFGLLILNVGMFISCYHMFLPGCINECIRRFKKTLSIIRHIHKTSLATIKHCFVFSQGHPVSSSSSCPCLR